MYVLVQLIYDFVNRYRWLIVNSHESDTLVGNKHVDHSDVAGASPVDAALTTSSCSIRQLVSMDWAKNIARQETFKFCISCSL